MVVCVCVLFLSASEDNYLFKLDVFFFFSDESAKNKAMRIEFLKLLNVLSDSVFFLFAASSLCSLIELIDIFYAFIL